MPLQDRAVASAELVRHIADTLDTLRPHLTLAAHQNAECDRHQDRDQRHDDECYVKRIGQRRQQEFPVTPGKCAQFLGIDGTAFRLLVGSLPASLPGLLGRTGSVVAAYLRLERGATLDEAVHSMLSVGPPSLEQIAFVRALGTDRANRAPTGLTVLSRLLDAPRRTLSRVRGFLHER